MPALPWTQWTEPVVGEGHPTLADVDNRPLKQLLTNSGYASTDPDPYFLSGANAVQAQAIAVLKSTTPPVTPVDGKFYLVSVGGTGVWNGHDNQLARWSDAAATYTYFTPEEGWEVYVQADDYRWRFDGVNWGATLNYFGVNVGTGGLTSAGTLNITAPVVVVTAPSISFVGAVGITGSVLPSVTNTYDLGSTAFRWRTGYFATSVVAPSFGTNTAVDPVFVRNNVTQLTLGSLAATFAGTAAATAFIVGTNPATVGGIRLPNGNASGIVARNAANGADFTLLYFSNLNETQIVAGPGGLILAGAFGSSTITVTTGGETFIDGAFTKHGNNGFIQMGSAAVATTGVLRLRNNVAINWRNAADSVNVTGMQLDASNILQIGLNSTSINLNSAATFTSSVTATSFIAPLFGTVTAVDVVIQRNSITQLTIGSSTAVFVGTVSAAGSVILTGGAGQVVNSGTAQVMSFAGGTGAAVGGNVRVFGSTHATQANDIEFRTGASVVGFWDDSAVLWTFTGAVSMSSTLAVTSTLTTNGTLTILSSTATTANIQVGSGTGSGISQLGIYGAAGQTRSISWRTGSLRRWSFDASPAAETGSDAGTNFSLLPYDDAGNVLASVFFITRATGGTFQITRPVTMSSTLDVTTSVISPIHGTVTAVSPTIVRNSVTQVTFNSLSADFAGDVTVPTGKVFRVNAIQVVAARITGYTNAMTGTKNRATAYATGTITLVQLAERVGALQDDLTTHGLIGV